MRKTKLRLLDERVMVKGDPYYLVRFPKPDGRGGRRFFKKKGDAETFVKLKKTEIENYGTAANSLNESARAEYLECRDALKPFSKSLRDAVNFYIKHLTRISGSKKVREVIDELQKARRGDGMSKRYLGDIRVRLAKFAGVYGDQVIASLTAAEIDGWLRSLPVGGVTRNSFRRRLATLFSFAKKRKYVSENPIADVERAKEGDGEIEILTVGETAKLLESASLDMLPFWTIGAFAGLRRAEIERLEWSEIDFEDGLIEVKASKSKTASRRLVTMQPNLREWLAPYRNHKGRVCPLNLQRKINDDLRLAGFGKPGSESKEEKKNGIKLKPWPSNALRHGFGSYQLAQLKDAAALALQMGNSPAMIFKHYREIVKPKEAAKYWNITPASVGDNIVTMTAAA